MRAANLKVSLPKKCLLAFMLICCGSMAAADVRRSTASSSGYANEHYDNFDLERKDFRFFSYKAWLNPNGEWYIEGPISHKGLLCGTYELGMRFGVGVNGCTDVEWLTPDRYISSEMQCNNASMIHKGGDGDPILAERYKDINCAERIIRCSDNCK